MMLGVCLGYVVWGLRKYCTCCFVRYNCMIPERGPQMKEFSKQSST